ncbi:MAG: hypothetical protein JXR37_14690 [Kiritimatiellae bacterium]|nr:hypothetical protein [Kiritimatiellia bacterium]
MQRLNEMPRTARSTGALIAVLAWAFGCVHALGAPVRTFKPGEHPRLYFWREDIPKLRAMMTDTRKSAYGGVTGAALTADIIKKADHFLTLKSVKAKSGTIVPLNPPDGGPPYLDDRPGIPNEWWMSSVERTARPAIEAMVTAYLLTGERKYADRAIAICNAMLDWPKWWDSAGYKHVWHGTQEHVYQVAYVYDCLFDELQRRGLTAKYQRAMIEKAIIPLVKYARGPSLFGKMGTIQKTSRGERWANKDSAMTASIGIGALVLLGDVPGMEPHVEFAVDRLRQWSDEPLSEAGIDGLSVEGAMYSAYGFYGPFRFAEALFHAAGDRRVYDLATIRNNPVAMLYTTVAEGERIVGADGVERPEGVGHFNWSASDRISRSSGLCTMMLLQQRLRDPAARNACRLILRTLGNPLETWETHRLPVFMQLMAFDPTEPLAAVEPAEKSLLLPNAGYAVLRSGFYDPDTVALMLRCGRLGCKFRHSQNALKLHAFGRWFLAGGGYSAPQHSAAYSTLLLDGKSQIPRPVEDGHRIDASLTPALDYARGVLTGVYPLEDEQNTFSREVMFVAPGYALLRDTVNGAREVASLFQPARATIGAARRVEKAEVVARDERGFTLRNGPVDLRVRFLAPAMRAVEFTKPNECFPVGDADAKKPWRHAIIAHAFPREDKRHELLTLLCPEKRDVPQGVRGEVIRTATGGIAGVKVTSNAAEDFVAFADTDTIAGDARVMMVRRDGSRFALVYGRSLSVSGRPWLTLGARGGAGFARENGVWVGAVELETPADVTVRLPQTVRAVELNGKPLAARWWHYDSARQVLTIRSLPHGRTRVSARTAP